MENQLHVCGGTILSAGKGPSMYEFCDRCGAYTYDSGPLPSGANRTANDVAYHAGELRSPDAELTRVVRPKPRPKPKGDTQRMDFLVKHMRIISATNSSTRHYIDVPVADSFREAVDAAIDESI